MLYNTPVHHGHYLDQYIDQQDSFDVCPKGRGGV